METDNEYSVKITKVLNKLLDPNFKIKNDVYLNALLTNLIGTPENNSVVDCTVSRQQIPTWLMEAVSKWEKLGRTPSPSVLSFTLTLAGAMCKNEQTFVMLNSHNIYERLIKLIRPDDPSVTPTVKLGYIKLVLPLLEHKSGLQWIISTTYWADIMNLTLKNQTIYITKEGYRFLATLLEKSIKINEMFSCHVVRLMMAPLDENSPCSPPDGAANGLEIRDQAIYQTLCSTLNLITEILEILLADIKQGSDMKVVALFMEKFSLERKIRKILMLAQNECFVFDLYKILYLLCFFDLYKQFGGKGEEFIEYEKALQSSIPKIYDVLKENLARGSVKNLIKFTYIGFVYWDHISARMPICVKYGNNVLFENQMLMLQVYPIISVSFQLLGEKAAIKILAEDDVRDDYVDKICKRLTPDTMRVFFQWRKDIFFNSNIFDNATLALSYLIKSKQFFTRELGVTAFQTLIYCLRDIIQVLKDKPEQILTLSREHNYMTLVLEAVSVFINEFKVTWRDSLESMCVMNLAFEFLSLPTWSTKLVVKGLKLVDVSISKYMAPNMALLIDNINDSTMAVIGPMLFAKLHDGDWEVRDTALEVLCTISNNAKEKFPSFRKIILEADLPSLILKMCISDGESFVRATAVKCLQEMVQVPEFWEDLLKNGNIHEQLIQILQIETEGIVRSQAATLVAMIYEHQGLPQTVLSQFYDIMSHAATADLHWEVKVNALLFWEKVITCHLTHQGMIDGVFPKVTFSKEHRKIVTLNEPEVRKRLVKVLNQLSETGCLAVLITALKDDCDVEVIKAATKITDNFVKLLKNYNITDCSVNLSNPPSPLTPLGGVPSPPLSQKMPSVSTDSQYQSMSPLSQLSQNSLTNSPQMCSFDDMTDSILDDIINSQDIKLLQNVYNIADKAPTPYLQLQIRQTVMPSEFLKFTYNDLESHVNKKKAWLDGMEDFGSLLDDILKEYDTVNNNVNSMDCY